MYYCWERSTRTERYDPDSADNNAGRCAPWPECVAVPQEPSKFPGVLHSF
jgi:hypothetical protein